MVTRMGCLDAGPDAIRHYAATSREVYSLARLRQFEVAVAMQQSAFAVMTRLDRELRAIIVPQWAGPDARQDSCRLFHGTTDQVRAVRVFAGTSFAGHVACDDATLAASELMTNSVTHSKSGRAGGMVMIHLAEVDSRQVVMII